MSSVLEALNREELQGVVGHEMGHIVNWDIRYATAVGVIVGLIALVSDGALRSLRYSGRSRSSSSGKAGAGAVVILLFLLLFAALAPLFALQTADLLSELGFGPEVLDWSVSRLSTGERQRRHHR